MGTKIRFLLLFCLSGSLLSGCSAGASGGEQTAILALLAAQANGSVTSTLAYFSNGQSATNVIGQADLVSGSANRGVFPPTANTFSFPSGVATLGSRLYVSDLGNHRTLGFNAVPTSADTGANFVVGQSSFAGAGTGTTANRFNSPRGAGAGNGLLAIADQNNHRVQLFNPAPTSSDPSATVALGAAGTASQGNQNCTASDLNGPITAAVVNNRVIVADSGNGRVLIWNSIPSASYAAADIVIGKATKTGCGGSAPAANSLASPFGVWSDGTRLLVVDRNNSRVLLWNTFPTTDGQAADVALGQPSLTDSTGLSGQANLSLPTRFTRTALRSSSPTGETTVL